ncbi:MAG: GTPase Era [bacterium]|nr:GTPase Era [bacterium]
MTHRAGFVAIAGRPNVGKSTLLNALVGTKVAIVTPKPQTTRNRVAGIRTLPQAQAVFLDTPGLHAARSPINKRMVEVARQTLAEADAILFVVDATVGLGPGDRELATELAAGPRPVIVVANKIDRVAKPKLLPLMASLAAVLPGRDIVPLSARSGDGVARLLEIAVPLLPEGPALYPDDEFTPETQRFLVQELVREQVFLAMHEEIPYGTAVVVEHWEEKPEKELVVIDATILVERDTHKGMIVGGGGSRLKDIGTRARHEIEALLDRRVFLELFVRVEPNWSRSGQRLSELGLR